jgi:hypothetical protein
MTAMPLQQQPEHQQPTDLLSAVIDVFLTTKVLSELLPQATDLYRLAACSRSFRPFQFQIRELRIREAHLTERLLNRMEGGEFADVTTINFEPHLFLPTLSAPSPHREGLEDHLRSASRALSRLRSLTYQHNRFAIQRVEAFDAAVRARLLVLRLDLGFCTSGNATLDTLLQGSPQLQTLSLWNIAWEHVVIDPLVGAFKSGHLSNLQKLELRYNFDGGLLFLPAVLAPILDGHAPNLKNIILHADLKDKDIDDLIPIFPFLHLLDLSWGYFSASGNQRLRQAAESFAELTLLLPQQ